MNERGRNRFLGAIVGLGVGLVIVLLLYVLISTRGLIGEVRNAQKNNTGTIDVIRDCTESTGQCFKDGQRRTAKVVGDISLSQVAAVACADQEGQQDAGEIAACVKRTIKAFVK